MEGSGGRQPPKQGSGFVQRRPTYKVWRIWGTVFPNLELRGLPEAKSTVWGPGPTGLVPLARGQFGARGRRVLCRSLVGLRRSARLQQQQLRLKKRLRGSARDQLRSWTPKRRPFLSEIIVLGPETSARRDSSYMVDCTENQPRRPIRRSFRGHVLVLPYSRPHETLLG